MAAAVSALNAMPAAAAHEEFMRCCGSSSFAAALAACRPFASPAALHEAAARVWWNEVSVPAWLEAFTAHPRIGDVSALRAKFAATAKWCEGEQSAAMASADEAVLQELAAWNARYVARFGHVFLICATGVAAADVLAALQRRFPSSPHAELAAAAGEQAKITALRLDKLLASLDAAGAAAVSSGAATAERRVGSMAGHLAAVPTAAAGAPRRSAITTHVLDTALGKPAAGVAVALEHRGAGHGGATWATLARGVTDGDGRCGTLLPPGAPLAAGQYRISFETEAYLAATAPPAGALQQGASQLPPFFPAVSIVFAVAPQQAAQHFHVPLLIAPYAFSTYRGS